MSEPATGSNRQQPVSVGFFDWRSRRNWVVLIGSALTTGVVAAVLAYVVGVVGLDLPSAPLSLSDILKAWFVGGLLFLLVVLLMGRLATRESGPPRQEARPTVGPKARRAAQRLELKIEALWCVVFLMPPLAMRFTFVSLRDNPGAVEVTTAMCIVGLVVGPTFLPALLQRWGRIKPPG